LRDKAAFLEAIKELSELGRARLVQDGRKRLVQINPALISPTVARVAAVAVAGTLHAKTALITEAA